MKPRYLVHFKVIENNRPIDGSILMPKVRSFNDVLAGVEKHGAKGKPFVVLSISNLPDHKGDIQITSGVRKILTEALNKIREQIKTDLKDGAPELEIRQKNEDKTVIEKLLS